MNGSVASDSILYFEWSTKDARMRVGAYFMKCNGSKDACLGENRVALNHANIRSSRKSRGSDVNSSGKAARKPTDDGAGVVDELG